MRIRLCLMILSLLPIAVFAQRGYDPQSVPVTRWLDKTTRPMTYAEYIGSRDFAASARISLRLSTLANTEGLVDIIINEDLFDEIADLIDVFILDLQIEGYAINMYTAAETQSPEELRQLLANDWQEYDLVGSILIGDLAVPWYEMYEPPDWGGSHVEFPIDLYLMDLDGIWGDGDDDGRFDGHGGTLEADIWIGRLVSSPMHYHGATEVTTMRNYLEKNHRYRTGELRLDDHSLAFIDNDWCEFSWPSDVALAYPETDPIIDVFETNRANYINYMRETSNNRYEHLLICSHSSAFAHYIFYDYNNYQLFNNHEIETYMMQALSYNLFACSNSRYIENDNMGGWYIFETEYGLISIGSTKTGAMLCFEDFYLPLGEGASFGNAFLQWAQIDMESCAGDQSRPWFYGMCLQGDPTIKLGRWQPPSSYLHYMPGDINGDSLVQADDAIYGVRYLEGVGEPPPDSGWDAVTGTWLYVAGDVNGNCAFLGSDISYLVSYFQGLNDSLGCCPRFPIPPPPAR